MKSASAKLSVLGLAMTVAIGVLCYTLGRRSVDAAASAQLGPVQRAANGTPGPRAQEPGSEPGPHVNTRMEVSGGEAVRALGQATAALESAKVYERDDRTLEQKYAGASLGQLLAAESLLAESRDRERGRIGAELIANNKLTIVTRAVGGDSPTPQSSNADGSPVTSIQVFETVNGNVVEKAAVVSGEEYPDYRALELEVWWLQCKVHELKKSQKPALR